MKSNSDQNILTDPNIHLQTIINLPANGSIKPSLRGKVPGSPSFGWQVLYTYPGGCNGKAPKTDA